MEREEERNKERKKEGKKQRLSKEDQKPIFDKRLRHIDDSFPCGRGRATISARRAAPLAKPTNPPLSLSLSLSLALSLFLSSLSLSLFPSHSTPSIRSRRC